MSGFLLDTNVLSEFNHRREPDPRVQHWLEAAASEALYASVLTFGERICGAGIHKEAGFILLSMSRCVQRGADIS